MSDGPEQDKPGRIEIRVPAKIGIDDDNVWEDLEKYLFDGFLTTRAVFSNQQFVFKTLNHNEIRYINFCRSLSNPKENRVEFRAAFIAHSVFIVNGSNALHDRPKNIDRLVKLFRKLPSNQCDKILESLSALNDKASHLYPLVEAYANENRSRYKWYQIRDNPMNSPSVTGIPGSDEFGFNYSQLTWMALNRIQDMKDGIEKDWQNAKFIGGCFAGKGMRTVEDRDRSRLERERQDREELKEKVLHAYLNRGGRRETSAPTVTLPDGRIAEVTGRFRADSAEELAQQLTMALNNEKDAHDIAIEEYEAKAKIRMAEIENEKSEILRQQNTGFNDLPLGSSVISQSGMSERMKRMRELVLDNFKQVNSDDRPLDPDTIR